MKITLAIITTSALAAALLIAAGCERDARFERRPNPTAEDEGTAGTAAYRNSPSAERTDAPEVVEPGAAERDADETAGANDPDARPPVPLNEKLTAPKGH